MHKYKFKSLKQHCFDLSHFCIYTHHQHPQYAYLKTLAEWIRLASRIKSVQLLPYSSEKRDADTHDLFHYLRSDLDSDNTEHVYNLTLFSYVWAAFESLISNTHINPDNKTVFELMRESYEPYKNLIGYNETVRELKKQFRFSKFLRSQELKGPSLRPSRSSRGMHVIFPIRSYFGHLTDHFPVGMDAQEKDLLEKKIITNSTRIVLLSIQMLLLSFTPEDIEYVDNWWKTKRYRKRTNLHVFLRTVHLNLA